VNNKHEELDRNFDDLAQRFKRNIYDSMKGKLRLAILRRDFAEHLPNAPINILDVGAGQGQWALELLTAGHRVCLTDISQQMLTLAQEQLSASNLSLEMQAQARFLRIPVQNLANEMNEQFDLIQCHAVMEWLEDPQQIFVWLKPLLKKNGWCSIIFYNRHGLIFKNLLRTNYTKVANKDFRGRKGSLTPIHAFDSDEVLAWAKSAGFELMSRSGIRVFHDYILDKNHYAKNPEMVEQLELQYSQLPPYRDLGRYIHFMLRVL
jgi:S-adenosylmethionine-dependent methyltransferase